MNSSPHLSERVQGLQASALRTIFHAVKTPGMISFAGGLPASESFPELPWSSLQANLSNNDVLQYGASEGEEHLRQLVANKLTADGLEVEAERVLILSGSQQGIDLVAKLMIDKGTQVAIESPAYLAALQVFSLFGARYAPFSPFNLDDLAGVKANLLYTNPTFQNPTSHVYTQLERQRIADYCDASNTVLFEDDPYRDLVYEPCDRTPICSLTGTASWIYQSSFSKTLSPGLRLGYLVCSEDLYPHLLHLKQASDLHSNRVAQHIVIALLENPAQQQRLKQLQKSYRQRRDHFDLQLQHHFADLAQWQSPPGGLFFWLRLKPGCDVDLQTLLAEALQQGVAYMPGAAFYPSDCRPAVELRQSAMRLNFSHASEHEAEQGLARLSALIRSA